MKAPVIEHPVVAVPPALTEEGQKGQVSMGAVRPGEFRPVYWLGVPALALAAYVTALRVGFLADDYVMLFETRHGFQWQTYLPSKYYIFYRPVGRLIVWDIPWTLWSYNPIPYHVQSILVHGCAALVLGLWFAQATGRKWLGWLAGALFAVFPLNTEAVGWLAGQWDAWALLFGLICLWTFTLWWKRPRGWLYLLSLLSYTLGLYTKESMLAWLPMLGVAVWFISPGLRRVDWKRLALSMLPFAGVLGLVLFQRFSTLGYLGGYPQARTDILNFFWDATVNYARVLLAPVSAAVAGNFAQQTLGAVISVLLLLALLRYGWGNRRALLMAALWLAVTIVPVINLEVHPTELVNNRFLYIPAAGYCLALAVLIHAALESAGKRRSWGIALVGTGMVASLVVAAVNLWPWHTATVQVQDLGRELTRLVPPQAHPNGLNWYVTDVPETYKGATLLILGLDRLRYFDSGEELQLRFPLVTDTFPYYAAMMGDYAKDRKPDMFAMHFAYSAPDNRYHADQLAGITAGGEPPRPSEGGSDLAVWDFRSCAEGAVRPWKVFNAAGGCKPGEGLTLVNPGEDPQIVGPKVNLQPGGTGQSFVRLRVAMRLPAMPLDGQRTGQWFWTTPDSSWGGDRSASTVLLDTDGSQHVYWTYIPFSRLPDGITRLRFDPVNGSQPSSIQWIAADIAR